MCIRDRAGDERLPNLATTPFEAPRQEEPAVTVEQQLQTLTTKLADLGLDVAILENSPDDWCPDRNMPDRSFIHI